MRALRVSTTPHFFRASLGLGISHWTHTRPAAPILCRVAYLSPAFTSWGVHGVLSPELGGKFHFTMFIGFVIELHPGRHRSWPATEYIHPHPRRRFASQHISLLSAGYLRRKRI